MMRPSPFAPLQAALPRAPILVPPPFNDGLAVYPVDFAVPDRAPYSYKVDMGLLRSEFAAGNARQRRIYDIMPHMLALSFHMRVEELFLWQQWINTYAYTFFHCPVSTMYAGEPPDPANLRYETLRFASDLDIASDGWDWLAVGVAAELSNDAHAAAPPIGLAGWIVGGQPGAPSTPDRVLAGTPAAPSPDWILAGTPEFPSAY
jgi:hypothetical protein